jgi:hypothetical protein
MNDYQKLIEAKRHRASDYGIEPNFMPDGVFDFQRYAAEYAIKKGRCAVYFDTGMGKTLIELIIAANYVRHTNKPVLIATPLSVAFQFLKEAEKFHIEDVEYSREGKFSGKIIICNYERLHYFNPADFDCMICDESSCVKDFKSKTSEHVNAFMRKIKYRYLATATPSPNDYVELGTSSEALGYMGYQDMLTKFFTNNQDTISPMGIGVKWRLKGHAEEAFFQWVSGWSLSARKPSDLGFSDERHVLPALYENDHIVTNDVPLVVNGQFSMFNQVARTMPEIHAERKATIAKRAEKAVELASQHGTSVYWCNLNEEADTVENLDPNAVQIHGGMSLEKKEEILIAFAEGQIKKLVTKPKITAWGLNWQHCPHAVTFPGFSFEQYYQLVRRHYRFPITDPVTIDRVISDGQVRILQAIEAKAKKADNLFSMLNINLNKSYTPTSKEFDKQIQLPTFLK